MDHWAPFQAVMYESDVYEAPTAMSGLLSFLSSESDQEYLRGLLLNPHSDVRNYAIGLTASARNYQRHVLNQRG